MPDQPTPRTLKALQTSAGAYAEAVEKAARTRIQRDRLRVENQRLLQLIKALVDAQARLEAKTGCPGCGARGGKHQPECAWLRLAAEAANL